MKEVMRIAAFTGDRNAETAISERLEYTGDIIEERPRATTCHRPYDITMAPNWYLHQLGAIVFC